MRILLVEDERKVASFIARALRENTYAVDVAESGQKALELGADVPYDAILLDVRLPDLSGIEVCRELRQRGIEAPVMMLTARGLVEQRVEGLDAGADDYLTKPFVLAELLARVRALIRRGFHSSNAKLRYADLTLDRHRRRATRDKETIPLTSREFALLELLSFGRLNLLPEVKSWSMSGTATSTAKPTWSRFISTVFARKLIKTARSNSSIRSAAWATAWGHRGHEN